MDANKLDENGGSCFLWLNSLFYMYKCLRGVRLDGMGKVPGNRCFYNRVGWINTYPQSARSGLHVVNVNPKCIKTFIARDHRFSILLQHMVPWVIDAGIRDQPKITVLE